jgi:hypothetical protein
MSCALAQPNLSRLFVSRFRFFEAQNQEYPNCHPTHFMRKYSLEAEVFGVAVSFY